jgi:hypothetical protein
VRVARFDTVDGIVLILILWGILTGYGIQFLGLREKIEGLKLIRLIYRCYKMSDKNKEAPFQNFKSYKDAYEGYIQYFEEQDCYGLYIKYYEGRDNIYENVTLYGSWDNYERQYDLYQLLKDRGNLLAEYNSSMYFIILDKDIPYGKYTYKFKKGDEWIEPTDDELRQKDKDGNYNNVLFVHH